jgi:hypothetical protein
MAPVSDFLSPTSFPAGHHPARHPAGHCHINGPSSDDRPATDRGSCSGNDGLPFHCRFGSGMSAGATGLFRRRANGTSPARPELPGYSEDTRNDFCTVLDLHLSHDVTDVYFDCTLTHFQFISDNFVRCAELQQRND